MRVSTTRLVGLGRLNSRHLNLNRLFAGSILSLTLDHGLLVKRVEIDRLQQQLRETALGHYFGDRLTGEGIQSARAETA